jgi:hypothetical protein
MVIKPLKINREIKELIKEPIATGTKAFHDILKS